MPSNIKEGLPFSALDQSMLDTAGILRKNPAVPSPTDGLTNEAIRVFAQIALAGEGGLTKARLKPAEWKTIHDDVLPLEVQGLVQWEKDKHGKEAFLVLTWKGLEALEAAKSSTKPNTVARQRRAALYR